MSAELKERAHHPNYSRCLNSFLRSHQWSTGVESVMEESATHTSKRGTQWQVRICKWCQTEDKTWNIPVCMLQLHKPWTGGLESWWFGGSEPNQLYNLEMSTSPLRLVVCAKYRIHLRFLQQGIKRARCWGSHTIWRWVTRNGDLQFGSSAV